MRDTAMDSIEWNDVQGLLLSGYPRLPYSAYVVWRFRSDCGGASGRWLGGLSKRIMRAAPAEGHTHSAEAEPTDIRTLKAANGGHHRAINVALTATGLRKLNLDERQIAEFAFEFLEGMAPRPAVDAAVSRRSNLLGDIGECAPDRWDWGGTSDVDGMLLLFSTGEGDLQVLIESEITAMRACCEVVVSAGHARGTPVILQSQLYDDRKEHFGFTDGISQPTIEGSPKARRSKDRLKKKSPIDDEDGGTMLSAREQRISLVKPGEFVLGYPNERRESITSAVANEEPGTCDLLRNGTYLVFRQLEQDVEAFDAFAAQLAKQIYGNTDPSSQELAAARLIGRHKNGEPLISGAADSTKKTSRNDFLYAFEDGSGMACPVGAHIRRANPRDIIGPDPDTALRLSKMHRIIRRGRPYGPRRGEGKPDARRGIAFIALNADIAGQFEMIQHSWLNNPNFGGLYAGCDPIGHVTHADDEFAVQQRPANLHVRKPRPFVTVRGGAYFFLPGIKAIQAMADAAESRAAAPLSATEESKRRSAVFG